MEIYLVRHGATDANLRDGRYAGWMNPPLAAEGVQQARRTAARLESAAISRVVCSDLKRAIQTAHILAAPHKLPVETFPAWRELNYGEWDGLTAAEIEQRWPGALRRLSQDPGFRIPGGETLAELLGRILPALESLMPARGDESEGGIIIVSHKATIRVLLCHLIGLPIHRYKEIPQDNCAINRLHVQDGTLVVADVNITEHLRA